MLAALVEDWGREPTIGEVAEPVPGPGETLVEVKAATVSHIDLSVLSGEFFLSPGLPYVPGSEGAGVVLESPTFAPGTPVRIAGEVGLTRNGVWAERVAAADADLEALPAGTDLCLGASYRSPCATAYAAVTLVGRVAAGERVAVTGATGSVGAMVLQLAREAGAEAFGIHRDPDQAELLPAGVTSVPGDDPARFDAYKGEDAFDLVVDTVGGPLLAELATGAIRPGGRAMLVGYAGEDILEVSLTALISADVSLVPLNLIFRAAEVEAAAPRLLERVEAGELEVRMNVFPFAELADALALLRAGTGAGRVVCTVP
jgi:NADPH:quinone reductase